MHANFHPNWSFLRALVNLDLHVNMLTPPSWVFMKLSYRVLRCFLPSNFAFINKNKSAAVRQQLYGIYVKNSSLFQSLKREYLLLNFRWNKINQFRACLRYIYIVLRCCTVRYCISEFLQACSNRLEVSLETWS